MRRSLLFLAICVLSLPLPAAPTELFFSEYIEGSSNNKALEIYNGTGSAINLGTNSYNVQMFFNGNPVSTLTINLTGTVANGDVFVLAQASASATILAQADQTNGSGWFNGDDAVVLRKGTTVIDVIGQVGTDPGTEWGSSLTSTADNTIRRKPSICGGDTNGSDAFNPATEWDGFASDTFGGLGAHTVSCGPTGPTGVGAANPASVEAGQSSVLTVTVTPLVDSGAITVTANLTSIGGTSNQTFYDDGATGGDVTLNDNIFTWTATVGLATSGGNKTLPVTITDSLARVGNTSITLGVIGIYEIHAIQGSGFASPVANQVVKTVDNIVTAVHADGFFIQTPEGRYDGDSDSSQGIYVYTGADSNPAVSVGDQVDVRGTVEEFFNLTEIGDTVTFSIDSSDNPVPAPVLLDSFCGDGCNINPAQPFSSLQFERLEGMIVRVENGRVGAPSDQFGDVQIVADDTRPFREPGIEYPGVSPFPVWDGNREIFDIAPAAMGLPEVLVPGGSVVDIAEGPLAFAFSDYQIWPTTFAYTAAPLPVAVRGRNAGEMTVAGQNLHRVFDEFDDPAIDDSDNDGDPFPHGEDDVPANPDDSDEYENRLGKISEWIRTVLGSPDVLAVSEVENITVLDDLAAQIDSDAAAAAEPLPGYSAYLMEGHDVGGIDVGFLVRDTVQVGSVTQFGHGVTWEFNSVDQGELNDRPPLVLEGSYIANGTPFPITVIAVHQRSLSGIDGNGSGAQRVRAKRHEQALQLSQYLQSLQTIDPDRRIIAIGDFNAFEFTDGNVDVMAQVTGTCDEATAATSSRIPCTDEVNPDFYNRTFDMPLFPFARYSYVNQGSAQTLDHAITSANLDEFVREFTYARGNADAPPTYEFDFSTVLRVSDHDAPVLFIMTDFDGDGLPDDHDLDDDDDGVPDTSDSCPHSNPTPETVVIAGCDSGVPDVLLASGCSITDSIMNIAANSYNHGDFVSQVSKLTNELAKQKILSKNQKGQIQSCAANANIP